MFQHYVSIIGESLATTAPAIDVPDQPHQPLTFAFPKRSFGKKALVFCSFQPSWFSQWPFLYIHYDEANDVVYMYMQCSMFTFM